MTATTTSANSSFGTLPFNGFVFFNIDSHIYTARKKLTPADLGLRAEDLPPATLASLGSMASADPSELTKFNSIRSAMQNACLVYGTRALGAYAVPEAHAEETAERLEELKAQFYALKAQFMAKFEQTRDEWLAKPEFAAWTDKIRARLDTVSHVDASLYIDFQPFVLGSTKDLPGATDDESPLAAGVIRARNGVEQQACKELAVMANSVMDNSLHDDNRNVKTEVTQKILSPIRRILEKADVLSFAAPNLRHVITHIKSVLSVLPLKGKLTDKDLTSVFNLVQALQRPEDIIRSATLASTSSVEVSDEDAQAIQMILAPVPVQQIDPASANVEDDIDAPESFAQAEATPSIDGQVATSQDIVYDDCF